MEGSFNEVLGLWTWDEDRRGDFEREAVELLLAGNVLDGLVFEAARDERFVESFFNIGELARWMGEKSSARDLQGMKKQPFGVAMSVGAEMLAGGQLLCSDGEGLT